jgi:predicted transcriptional regulator
MNEECMQVCMLIGWPICFGSVARKPTVRELRERAGLQIRELSPASDVSEASINRMERKAPVGVVLVNKVLRVINERLGTNYEAHEVDVTLL